MWGIGFKPSSGYAAWEPDKGYYTLHLEVEFQALKRAHGLGAHDSVEWQRKIVKFQALKRAHGQLAFQPVVHNGRMYGRFKPSSGYAAS